jgi:hypothetical protein
MAARLEANFRIGGAASLGLLIGLILFSFPAAAEVYPVSGVWTAIDTDFPAAANETCLAIKTFGVEAVSKKNISEMIIFAKDTRTPHHDNRRPFFRFYPLVTKHPSKPRSRNRDICPRGSSPI